MKSIRLLTVGAAAVAAALFGACSGSVDVSIDGPTIPPVIPPSQTSEAIVAQGAITGFGGITINGVRYSAGQASVTVNDEPASLADLQQGQVVTIRGRINADQRTGTASSIRFHANAVGPVESADAVNQELIVMGQPVVTGEDTLFDNGIDPVTYAGLGTGQKVQISGYADADGAIRATRVGFAPGGAELQLIGCVENLDIGNLLFSINRLTVDYSGAIVVDLPGGAPGNGMAVRVVGTVSGNLFHAQRLVAAPALDGNNGERVQVAGVITRFASAADFDVNTATARANAATAYSNGDAGDLRLNADVLLDGYLGSGGRITADRITYGRASGDIATLVYDFRDFTEIAIPTVFNVDVTQGADFSVMVRIDEGYEHRVDITQSGSRLEIALLPGNGQIAVLHAIVTMPVLNRIDLTGVSNATLNDFNQSQMMINVGNVSLLRGHGLTIGQLTANVSGVSQLNLGDIRPIGYADIDVSGVSQATLNMAVGSTMTGSVRTGQGTGTSTLFYYGTNVDVEVTTDSSSSIVRLGDTRP